MPPVSSAVLCKWNSLWAALRAESIQGGPVPSGTGVVLALWSQIIQDFGLGPQPDTASRLLETDSVERHILRCSATVGTLISPIPSMSGKLVCGVSPCRSWLLSKYWLFTGGFTPTLCGLSEVCLSCYIVALTFPRESTPSFCNILLATYPLV